MKTFKIKLNDTVTGLTNTTWDPTGVVSGRAATEDQLAAAMTPMTEWHTIVGIKNEYYLGKQTDIAAFVSRFGEALSYPRDWTYVQTLPLDVTVAPYEWSLPNIDGEREAITDIIFGFPDGSTLVKKNVRFLSDNGVEDRVYAVRLGEGATVIDTGLTLNFAYRFEVRGYIEEDLQGCLISAPNRTSVYILGGSNQAHLYWPDHVQVLASDVSCASDRTFSYQRMCKIIVSGRKIPGENYKWFIEGKGDNEQYCSIAGTNESWRESGTDSTKIYLLNERPTSTYKNAILREAKIYNENDVLIRHFQGAKRNGEIVIVDALTDTIYRPDAGVLEEVTL